LLSGTGCRDIAQERVLYEDRPFVHFLLLHLPHPLSHL
jgi:hypothetical protein